MEQGQLLNRVNQALLLPYYAFLVSFLCPRAFSIFTPLKKNDFIYLFLALLGLCLCECSPVAVLGLLMVGAPLITDPGLQDTVFWSAVPGLQSTGSIVVTHRLSCSAVYGILPDSIKPVSCIGRRILYHQVTQEAPKRSPGNTNG